MSMSMSTRMIRPFLSFDSILPLDDHAAKVAVFFGGQQQTVVGFGQILRNCHSLVLEFFAV